MLDFMGIPISKFNFRGGLLGIVSGMVIVIFLLGGILTASWVARFILKVWNWNFGQLSLDDRKQSILDFGS